jgi:hypothetical protein
MLPPPTTEAKLVPGLPGFPDLLREAGGGIGIDPELPVAHQGFTRKLQKDAVEARTRHWACLSDQVSRWKGGAP